MNFLRTYRWEIAIALLALVVHAICFFVVVSANDGNVTNAVRDSDGYLTIATNVLAGNGFSAATTSPYTPNALRTPGYIYFLAGLIGITGSVSIAAAIQLLISSLIPVLGMHIARHITNSVRIGIGTGIVLALDPTLALLSFELYTDTLFVVFFLAWTLLMFRYLEHPRWITLVSSAIILGIAIIIRPTVQYIPLLVVPFILWRSGALEWRRGVSHALMLFVIVGTILTPWIMRNNSEFGALGLSAQKDYVLYTNFAPAVLSVARGSDFETEFTAFSTQAEREGGVITPQNGHEYSAQALDVILAHPSASAYIACKSLFTFFTNDGVYTLLAHSGHPPANFLPLLIAARLAWVLITVSAFVGALVYLWKERSPLAILIILLVAYFALTSIIAAFGTNPRYRLGVDPIILALAGVGGMYLYERFRNLRNKLVNR